MTSNPLVLLIDDEASLRTTVGDFLAMEGYEVATAESGEDGLRQLRRLSPDVIILDMNMPGMGGIGFLKAICNANGVPEHPVLVLTARGNMAEFFTNLPVAGFVAKPCEPQELLTALQRIVHAQHETSGAEAGGREPETNASVVLVGEDDGAIRHGLVQALQSAGYETVVVSRGPDVLEQAIVKRPAVVLLKLVLPGMNGDAVAKMLQQVPTTAGLPVILYDDTGDPRPAEHFLEAGIGVKKMVHSCDRNDLLAAVQSVRGRPSAS